MDDSLKTLLNLIPEHWRTTAGLGLFLFPYATRAFHSLKNGGGLRGVWSGIMYGTNTPKSQQPDPNSNEK